MHVTGAEMGILPSLLAYAAEENVSEFAVSTTGKQHQPQQKLPALLNVLLL